MYEQHSGGAAMKVFTRHSLAMATAFALASPGVVLATNGMYLIGYGAKGTAMGGAGVAYPQDAMATAYNPASMTEVGESRLDGTLELFRPPRAVKHDSTTIPADHRSKDDLFPIPAIGAVMSSPGTPFAMGMAVVGAGLGTNYDQSAGTMLDPTTNHVAYDRVGVFLMQMQMLPSIAFKVNENHSVGASLVIAAQTFRAFGLEAFTSGTFGFTTSTETLTNRGYDWSFGWGVRYGWFGKFLDGKLNLGFNHAPRVSMQKFNRYSGLFAEHGEFDIPENFAVGIAYKFTPKLAVAFDVQRILWNDVASIGHSGPTAIATPLGSNPLCPQGSAGRPECLLGGDLGMGFGWTNQWVYKLGFDYKYSKDLSFRAGYNYGKSPIPEDQVLFNMLAPATVEKHVTFGATYALANNDELSFTFMHAFENVIKGPTMFDGASASLAMSQTSISIAYGLKF
jgi:long-chain fatty acid transport protein